MLRWFRSHPWGWLPLLSLPALWPLWTLGLTASADGTTHLMRIALLVHHWRQGLFYPRWVPELVAGLGYPVLSYYAPATYYLVGGVHLLGVPLAGAMAGVFVLCMLAGALGMYRLASELFGDMGRGASLVAAVAYLYAPYLLANVYVRGAIAEVGAQALLPWILWAARRLMMGADRPAVSAVTLAVLLGALALTHTVTLILFPPLLAGYLLVLWWQQGRSASRLGWALAALGGAMGLSAFFWVPLLAESGFLRQDAFTTSIEVFIPENLWNWNTIVDLNFPFEYTFDVPYQLGILQLVLAVAGIASVRRWTLEWRYWLGVTLWAGLAIGAWSEPLWLGSRAGLAIQFPWRLLSLLSVSLPLWAGWVVLRLHRRTLQTVGVAVLCGATLLWQRPLVAWMGSLATEQGSMPLAAIARHEAITGQWGTGPTREFMPRWSQALHYQPEETDVAAPMQIRLHALSGEGVDAQVTSEQGGAVRLTSFYFPGWQATLGDGTLLEPVSSTSLGLLTVDVPPGSHRLRLTQPGTALQRWATWLTWVTLAGLVALAWRVRLYGVAGVGAALLLVGSLAVLRGPVLNPVLSPAQPFATAALTLLGYRVEQGDPGRLHIYPAWFVMQTPQQDLRLGWEVLDSTGQRVTLAATRPYFNSQRASNWPPGTLVDDAYEVMLPAGLSAGNYTIRLHLLDAENRPLQPSTLLGVVALRATLPAQVSGAEQALALRFGETLRLDSYMLEGPRAMAAGTTLPVVRAGETLVYSLAWSAIAPPLQDYHGFVHLTDAQGAVVAQDDHLAGTFFHPPMSWGTGRVQRDSYRLQVPAGTPNGLLWPVVGLYQFESLQRLAVADSEGQRVGDAYRLPPVKVYTAGDRAAPQQTVDATFGDLAVLLGYDLVLPATGLQPGSEFQLTLYYQARGPAAADLTQFVHLFDPGRGMAAQLDAPPLRGANPTSAWQAGEVIVESLTLRVEPHAAAGLYTLGIGLYNPLDGVRLAVLDRAGQPLRDQIVPLTQLAVQRDQE